jgi:hypothetical protein
MMGTATDDPVMRIRLPAELKAAIESAARHFGRSMNAEIVHRLSQTFTTEAGDDARWDARILKMNEVLHQIAERSERIEHARLIHPTDDETRARALRAGLSPEETDHLVALMRRFIDRGSEESVAAHDRAVEAVTGRSARPAKKT